MDAQVQVAFDSLVSCERAEEAELDPTEQFMKLGRNLLQAFRLQLILASDPSMPLSRLSARLHKTAIVAMSVFSHLCTRRIYVQSAQRSQMELLAAQTAIKKRQSGCLPLLMKADDAIEKNDAMQQFGAAPPVLMVLTSEKGWPYSRETIQDLPKDVFVNCEVDRVWQIVKGDITAWFSSHGGTDFRPERRVLIGTPGIGKSVAAGSYLLYQLLHCDAEKIQVVVHCFVDAYVSDKNTRAVTRGSDEDMCVSELRSLRGHGRNAYIIYDVSKEGTPPPGHFAPTSEWGMIAVSSPKVTSYDEWAKQLQAARVIVNCPDELDVKAMCAWITRDETKEKQAEYWKEVKKHMYLLGPIPRHVFDEEAFRERCGAVKFALQSINEVTVKEHFSRGGESPWYSEDPSHKPVKVVREIYADAVIRFNAPISDCLEERTLERLPSVAE
ncbi:putative retrotransposon hot spot (RHS) protein [Trypanosoma cruzi]|nr:putative retrotransposon hot spot (RHS) protein [Trypanosoma cruzi]